MLGRKGVPDVELFQSDRAMTPQQVRSHNPLPGAGAPLKLAAGGILRRCATAKVEICLIRRRKYQDWSLPKGKMEPGETLEETAVREVQEEAHCTVRLGPYAGVIDYWTNAAPKIVAYWLMDLHEAGTFVANDEIEAFRWLTPEEALRELTYPAERELVARTFGLPEP
jgi:8-oxo-dGTP diphosphatase